MRTLFVLAVLAGPAFADPATSKPAAPKRSEKPKANASSKANARLLPDIVKEARLNTMPPVVKHGRLGIDGGWSSGHIIEPPVHPDSRPYPLGAVITPPDVNDPINLELGTNQVPARDKREPWLPRDLSLGFKRVADAVWDWVLPKL